MNFALLFIGFALKTIAIPVAFDDLFNLDNSLSSDSLNTNDQLIVSTSPDLQWESQDSDLLLALTEPSFLDQQLASSGACDEIQSSLDVYDDSLITRDVADVFPGLNELTAPLNELKKTPRPQCTYSNPENPSQPKQNVPDIPPDTSPDLFIVTGLEEGQCPKNHPIPLYCNGPWLDFFNVQNCSPCKFQPPQMTQINP